MNAYPIGNDLTVKWSLLYSDGSVFPLSNYDYEFSYRTNRGHKIVTDTSVISVEENILTWTFKSDEQVVSGRYTLCLKITLSGSKVVELQYDNAFMLSPISGFKGVGSEIVIQSYCDAIDLKDAVLQARKAMDLAADAVIDTAKSAEDAKAAKEAAENTAAQAKTDATSAMAMAMEASGKVAVAEQAATDASRDAASAQQAAQTASNHITSLEQAIAELPDGQAVSEKVAEHTTKLTDLESDVDGILCEMTSKEASSIAGENALLFDFVKDKKYKIRVRLSAEVGDFGLYINDANGSTIHNFGVKHNTDEWVEDDFIPSANADKLMVYISSANVQIDASVFLYKEIIYSEDIADIKNNISSISAEVSTLESSTNQNTQEIESLKYNAVISSVTENSIAGANALLFDFVKDEKYKIRVKLSAKVGDFGLYINDANGSTIHDFGVKHNTDEWIEDDFIPTADADKLMVYISSADVTIDAELTQLKEKDFSALSNIPTIFEFEKRIERELVVGANWNSARFEKGKTYSILVDTTKSLDALGLYTINDSNEVLDNLGVFSGSHAETEFTATKDAPYLVIYASASVSCSCTISEVSKKFNDELNHDIALATAFDKSKLSRKCGIVAFIFDDSLPYNDVALGNSCKWIYDEFTKRGLKFTIALSTIAEPIELSKYRRYVDEGHGILSHSIDHLDYVANSIEQVKADCVKTLDWLNNGGIPCRGFVYPNSSRNEEIQQLMRQYYGYAFGMQIKDTHITPNDDLYSLSRFGDVALKTFEQVKAAIDECIESKGLLVLWAHGYWIGTAGHTSQDEVIRMLDYLAEKKYSYEIEQTTVDKAMDMYF